MRVLIVDDDPSSVSALKAELDGRGVQTEICAFEAAPDRIVTWKPCIIVLDVRRGGAADAEDAGIGIFDIIWNGRFCPVVVYSAYPEALGNPGHPCVRFVKKGRRGVEGALLAIEELRNMGESLIRVSESLNNDLREAIKEVARARDDSIEDPEGLNRAVLRHIAARLDIERFGARTIRPEEQYIFPPVHDSLLTGDIIRKIGAKIDEASTYRVVLTPSCDLVQSAERKAKVSHVLVARCEPITSLGVTRQEPIERMLRQGGKDHWIVLPALGNKIPSLAANLKSLELIPLERISIDGSGDADFERVASIDSPFRERVTWAYLQIAGRPGLPDLDVSGWARSIHETVNTAVTA